MYKLRMLWKRLNYKIKKLIKLKINIKSQKKNKLNTKQKLLNIN